MRAASGNFRAVRLLVYLATVVVTHSTESPTDIPSIPSSEPTFAPTSGPSVAPTSNSSAPSTIPTFAPTNVPTTNETDVPTLTPTSVPTAAPSIGPTFAPTNVPTTNETDVPTFTPTSVPTAAPSIGPTFAPTNVPTTNETDVPTSNATSVPTAVPSVGPTVAPTNGTFAPSNVPTANTTVLPTSIPTVEPSVAPFSLVPTSVPTARPTVLPTHRPSVTSQDPTTVPTRVPSSKPTTFSPTSSPSTTDSSCEDSLPPEIEQLGVTCEFAITYLSCEGEGYAVAPTLVPKGTRVVDFCRASCGACSQDLVSNDNRNFITDSQCEEDRSEAPVSSPTSSPTISQGNQSVIGIPGECVPYLMDDSNVDLTYPDGLCSIRGTSGMVWVPAKGEGEEDLSNDDRIKSILLAAIVPILNNQKEYFGSVSNSRCFDIYMKWSCTRFFPPCYDAIVGPDVPETVAVPQLVCRDPMCDLLYSACGDAFVYIKALSPSIDLALHTPCTGSITSELATYGSWMGLRGQPFWPMESYTAKHRLYGSFEVPCLPLDDLDIDDDCDVASYEDSCPSDALLAMKRADGSCSCGMICALPVWDSDIKDGHNTRDWNMLVAAYTVPAFLSVPFNIMLAYAELVKIKRRMNSNERGSDKKRYKEHIGNTLLFTASILALFYVLIGPFISAVVNYDMICNGKDGLLIDDSLSNVIVEEGGACHLTKIAPHVLQAFNATVACILLQLYMKIHASLQMRRFDGGGIMIITLNYVAILIVPMLCMIIMFSLNVDPSTTTYDNAMADTLRNQFVCSARFPEVWQEVLFVHMPSMFFSIASLVLSVMLTLTVRKMLHREDTSSKKKASSGASGLKMTVIGQALVELPPSLSFRDRPSWSFRDRGKSNASSTLSTSATTDTTVSTESRTRSIDRRPRPTSQRPKSLDLRPRSPPIGGRPQSVSIGGVPPPIGGRPQSVSLDGISHPSSINDVGNSPKSPASGLHSRTLSIRKHYRSPSLGIDRMLDRSSPRLSVGDRKRAQSSSMSGSDNSPKASGMHSRKLSIMMHSRSPSLNSERRRKRRKKRNKVSRTTRALVVTMQRFAFASFFFLVLSTAATLGYIPSASRFSEGLARWAKCQTTNGLSECQIRVDEDPCDWRDQRGEKNKCNDTASLATAAGCKPFDGIWCIENNKNATFLEDFNCIDITVAAPNFHLQVNARNIIPRSTLTSSEPPPRTDTQDGSGSDTENSGDDRVSSHTQQSSNVSNKARHVHRSLDRFKTGKGVPPKKIDVVILKSVPEPTEGEDESSADQYNFQGSHKTLETRRRSSLLGRTADESHASLAEPNSMLETMLQPSPCALYASPLAAAQLPLPRPQNLKGGAMNGGS